VKPTPVLKISKKPCHIRSQSCPFTTPIVVRPEKNQIKKVVSKEERNNKTVLKKTLNNKPTLYKSKKSQQRHTNSQLSQDSNTVIVHNIPLEQLSSMLYSKNVDKERSVKKSESSLHLPTSISQSNLFERIHNQTDVYF
jgi:spore germination cell wall hydrolase CwlJ-like protein